MSSTSTSNLARPRIVARDQHGISRRQISQNALRVLNTLNEAGFDAYLVGGAVRALLVSGHPPAFDVAIGFRKLI